MSPHGRGSTTARASGMVARALATLLLAACGTTSRDADDDTLVIVTPRDAEQLDPRFVGDPYGLRVSRLLFASLVTIDPRTLDVVPDLAERITVETPTSYLVTLREGLRFSDGSTLDAEDVAATFEGVVDPDLGSRYAHTYSRIERVDIVDARTVRFLLDAPHATFMTDLELPVVRAEDARRPIARMDGPSPVGAGPYVLSRRRPGHVELAPNRYWHHGAPRFPKVHLVVVRDDNTRALRLRAGAADLAVAAVPPLLIPLFEKDPRFEVRTAAGVGTTYIGTHTEVPELRDVRVRHAIAHAIDRDALIAGEYGGRAQPTRSWVPHSHWASVSDLPTYPYDVARASRLLDEAGYPDPPGEAPRMRLTLRTSSDRFRLSVARAIAAMLRRVGIDVDVRPSEMATLIADMNAGRFELAMLEVPEVFEPHVLSWFFASDRVPGPGVGGANRWRYRNPALDAALEEGRANAALRVRRNAYERVQRLLARDLPVIPLWQEEVVAVLGPRAKGFVVPRDGRFGTLAR